VCKPGFLYRDLGEIIQETARKAGFSVNQTYCGHGINQQFHCTPNVPVRFPLPFSFFPFLLYLTLDLERNERRTDEILDG
jgi:hypothetical protein